MKTLRYALLVSIPVVLLLTAGSSFPQAKKIRLAVIYTGSDSIGQRIAFAINEAIRGSRSFVLFENDFRNPAIVLRIVTGDSMMSKKRQ